MVGTGLEARKHYVYACWINSQVTAFPLYGGNRLPFAIGAVVDCGIFGFHTPLSGHVSPVLAVVPIGFLAM